MIQQRQEFGPPFKVRSFQFSSTFFGDPDVILDLGKIEENLGSQQIDWKFIPPGTWFSLKHPNPMNSAFFTLCFSDFFCVFPLIFHLKN